VTLIYYDESGVVTAIRTGTRLSLEREHEANENCILIDGEVPEFPYVKDGQVLGRPESPKLGWFSFNVEQGEWQFDLDKSRDAVWSHMKYKREKAEFSVFEWGGYTFDCNEVSQRRLQGAIQLAAIDDTITLEWTLADNSIQAFAAAEYVQIGVALANHVSECHGRGRILRQEINESTTQAELEAIVW
jgi:hypothetical protein